MSELKDYFGLRKNIYRLLGKAFHKEADNAYLDEMEKYMAVFKEIAGTYDNADLAKGVEIYAAFREASKGKDVTEELAREFALIFLSTGTTQGIKSVIPHESVYLSPQGLTMQEQRDEVLEIYYNQGVGRSDNFKEPEDHISAEMGFMAYMSEKTAELIDDEGNGADENLQIQRDFLAVHLLKWAPKACDDVYNMGSDYYKAMALVTKGYLVTDKQFLDAIFEED